MENASRSTLTNASEQVLHALNNTATHPSAVAASGLPIAATFGGLDCYGQTDCVNGWSTAIGQATQDYNFNHGYNYYVYYWQQYCLPYHGYNYCSGYWHSYNYEWNDITQQQNQQSNQQSNQQINIYNYGNGNTFDTGQGSDQEQNQSP